MEELIRKYGEKDDKGEFWISKENALAFAPTILEQNKEMLPLHARFHVEENFNKMWNHYDVLLKGKLNAEMLPNMYRMMVHDMEM